MPEGHTLHRRARDHTRWLAGQAVRVSSPQGRFAEADQLDGRVFLGAEAWGKHLAHVYEGGLLVHIHLGLIGRFVMRRAPLPGPGPNVRYRVVGDARGLDLSGPMTAALRHGTSLGDLELGLGPDPLRADADPDEAFRRLQRKRAPLGASLADQRVIAGIGNVYRAEILFRAGLHPELPSKAVDRATFDALWADTVALLDLGARLDRIVTRDVAGTPPARVGRGERTWVYKKRACGRCGHPVRTWIVGGRKMYACEACQPPP
jgi:endonuclease-8